LTRIFEATGELLPISWDFSHFAVVKHLVPSNFKEQLLLRTDLIQNAQQFHFRQTWLSTASTLPTALLQAALPLEVIL
jgi:hypothetical protein